MNHEFQSLTEANQTVYYSDRSPQRMIREPSTLLRLARDSCVLAELTSHRLARQSQGSPKLFLLITVWDLEVNPVAESENWWRVPGRWCGATPNNRISKIDNGVQIALDRNYRDRAGREPKCLSFM